MRDLLRSQFERLSHEKDYSLRDLARLLDISHSALSLILSGKRPLSKKIASRILDTLELSEEEQQRLRTWIATKPEDRDHEKLGPRQAEIVSTWVHFAILNLLTLPKGPKEERGLARSLGLSLPLIRSVLQQLEGAQLVACEDGRYARTTQHFFIGNTKTSEVGKRYNQDLLQRAIRSMSISEFDQRDVSSIIFTLNKASLPRLKQQLLRFRRGLIAASNRDKDHDAVYALAIQLFPLTLDER